jgi:hypothetical protein
MSGGSSQSPIELLVILPVVGKSASPVSVMMIGIFMGIAGVSSDQQGGRINGCCGVGSRLAKELLRVLSVTRELAKTSWPDPDLRHCQQDME